MGFQFDHGYEIDKLYSKRVAYFCMEFGIDQSLKTYAGGLGFLAGSFMRSAYELKQNVVGIGILWKYGYYNQGRKQDLTMSVLFEEKNYGFLTPTGIKFSLKIAKHDVWVTAFYLAPEIFKTAPVFLLSTDLPENDYLAKTITHKLYDANPETSIAAAIILGEGGAKLLEEINWLPNIFHLNESHALPLAFYLFQKYKNINDVRKKLVYTNHTPEESGNQKTSITLLDKMSYFCDVPISEIIAIAKISYDKLDHTETCLSLSSKSNAVSLLHKITLINNCKNKEILCNIISITNAQNYNYWHDEDLFNNIKTKPVENIASRKKMLKNI
jgi:starch phosphorylase